MHTQARSVHNRSYSFSNWDSFDNNSHHQTRLYYNYPHKNQYVKHQYKDMPSFGDGPNGGRAEQYNNRSQSYQKYFKYDEKSRNIRESPVHRQNRNLDRQLDQNMHYSNKYNNSQHKFKHQSKWNLKNQNKEIQNCSSFIDKNNITELQLSRTTEQKFSNIDKINSKIRKILDTLNQEEKKISQNHIYLGAKKIAAHSHSYANRIKTQGDSQLSFQYRMKEKQPQQNIQNLYDKFVGIRQKHRATQQDQADRNILGQINTNKRERMRKLSDFGVIEEKKTYKYGIQQTKQNFRFKTSINQIGIAKPYFNYSREKQNKVQPQPPFQLLKGTNAKSTDSLNIQTSALTKGQIYKEYNINLMQQQKRKQYAPSFDVQQRIRQINKKYQRPCQIQQQSKYKQRSKQYVSQNKLYVASQNNIRQPNVERVKTESSFFNNKNKSDQRYDATPTFSSFGQSRTKKIQSTPKRSYMERSISKYEKSQKSCKLSNGKDLDAQIQKIQQKIEDFENIKKQLGVESKQFKNNSKEILNRSLSKFREPKSPMSMKQSQHFKNKSTQKYIPFSNQLSKYAQKQSQFSKFEISSQSTLKLRQIQTEYSKINEYQQNDNTQIQISLPKPFKMSSKKNTRRFNNSNVKQIQSAVISEERYASDNSSIHSLVQNLCKQIDLDQNLRNSKKWFNRKCSPYKWIELSKELSSKNIKTTQQQNKQIFTLAQQEDNPFHTTRDSQGSYAQLIENFLMSEQFWIQNLQHKYIRAQIERSIKQMDIQKKGNISIEDMVRYINLQSDKYYRNRDLSLVFRRLSGTKGQVTVQYILSEFCQF